jgi:uncharacterized protein YegL
MLPKVEVAKQPLHLFYLVDCSGSMNHDGKIQSVNAAMKEVIPAMRQVAREHPQSELRVCVLRFSTGAQWHVAEPTLIEHFQWTDLKADGETHLGAALRLLADQLKSPPMPVRAYPPVIILVSDGYPTDDFSGGLKVLNDQEWGMKAKKAAISIGDDAARPEAQAVFQKFLGHAELKPLHANNVEQIVRYIQFVSTTNSKPNLEIPRDLGVLRGIQDPPKPAPQKDEPKERDFDF